MKEVVHYLCFLSSNTTESLKSLSTERDMYQMTPPLTAYAGHYHFTIIVLLMFKTAGWRWKEVTSQVSSML